LVLGEGEKVGEEFGLVSLGNGGAASAEGGGVGQSTEAGEKEVEVDEVKLEERLIRRGEAAFLERGGNEAR
jgi:hypothetical protein